MRLLKAIQARKTDKRQRRQSQPQTKNTSPGERGSATKKEV